MRWSVANYDRSVSARTISWLDSLPAELERQRSVMTRMVDTARADERIRVVIVGCSIGRGAADALSDIDALIAVRPKDWDAACADSRSWVESWGTPIDLWQAVLPDGAPDDKKYQHTYAQWTNGVELDLVVSRLRDDWKRRGDWAVLYDPDGLVPSDVTPYTHSPNDVRQWGYAALIRLSALAKYVTRGALWEAHLCLENARADIWRISALADGVPDAQYGVTAVFDDPRRPVPDAMARTVAGLDKDDLRSAAIACCDVLVAAWPRAMSVVDASDAPPPLAAYVRRRLSDLST
jgi:predicted nucleotidyltransferase